MKFNLRELAAKKEYSLYHIAKVTNISYPTLHKIANNQTTRVDLETLEKLCNWLDCSVNDLLIK